MLTQSTIPPTQPSPPKVPPQPGRQLMIVLIGLVCLETLLLGLALVPAQYWTRVGGTALNGPFPAVIAPLITILLYCLPALIGFLTPAWQRAILYATLPAWIGLGVFLVAATFKIGAFYLVSADHVSANVGILELFAALGAIGWLLRHFIRLS